MPTHLPVADWTQARPAARSSRAFDFSCAAIGAVAVALAIFIDWFCYDRTGAVLVLLMAGGMIGLLLRGPGGTAAD